MKDHGISLIVADSAEEIESIARKLGIEKPSMLKSLESMIFVDSDAVFYCILRTKPEMEKLVSYFNVKRGVISCGGVRQLVGFNVDWTKRMLSLSRPSTQPIFVPEEERESAFSELGYR